MTRLPADWDEPVVKTYITPESHQKSRSEFEKTHIDIDEIRAEWLFPHPSTDEFVTQEEFRDAIVKSSVRDDNRIFILRGETGSGKSQLCQWLEYQIGGDAGTGGDDTHVALHVSRSQTRIKDIVEILTEPVDLDLQVGSVERLNPEKVADAMIVNLEAYAPTAFEEFSPDEVEALTADRSGTDLRSILESNIRAYKTAVASDDTDDIPDLIDEEDYRDIAVAAFGQARGGETIFPQLRGFLHDELSGKLNVGNFQEKLEQISNAYVEAGLRPVLICEDLTTFSVLKEQLLDHIFQLDSGHYDVVLGWTTGWEKDNLDTALSTSENTYTYMRDRAEGYLSTTDDAGRAYFLTQDATVELARKYVSVIRAESDGSLDADVSEDAFDGLYPFNAEFVQKAYDHLVQDGNERRTPRLLLIRIVRECLTANSPPFEAIEGNPYVKQFPTPVSIDLPSTVQSVAKWYARPTADGNLEIPRGVFEAFDVPVPADAIDDGDPVVLQSKGGGPTPELRLDQIEGTIEPGATVTVRARLNNRPEPDVDVSLDGTHVGVTGAEGRCELALPTEDGEVEIAARKADLSDSITFDVGTDSLTLTPTPASPDEGEEVTITARFNGNTIGGVQLYEDGQELGQTASDGTFSLVADDPPKVTVRGEIDGVDDEVPIPISEEVVLPVDVDLPSEEVDQRRFEYEQWIKTGSEYDSSETLRQGAVAVLETWHDPTRLANPNATTTGVEGIYYARGSETPVSIQSVNERQGLSIELPFGTEHNPVYEPLLWTGLSVDDELPFEDRYDLNYDLLRGWATEKVATFRSEMRSEIETRLPPGWTVEQFLVVATYLLWNGKTGTVDLDRDLLFREFSGTGRSYRHPLKRTEWRSHSYGDGYRSLTKSSSAITNLVDGFFKLKEGFVDDHRLSAAYDEVEANLDEYVEDAMAVEHDLPDAYRIGTTRSNASVKLNTVLERVSEYAYELNALGPSDVEYIQSTVETVDRWLGEAQNVPELLDAYESLHEGVGTLGINIRQEWDDQLETLRDGSDIHLGGFRSDVRSLRDVESATGPELVHLMHQYERSRAQYVEWDLYEAIDDMIQRAQTVSVGEGGEELEATVRGSDEMAALLSQCSTIESALGGDR